MANKDKIIKQAGKFIAKGQLDRAIKELQKAVELDPNDVRTLLKLGDVYSKKEDRENATQTYRRVADSYSEQGFFLKAVAVHKQILKHDGDNLEVRLKLAELYEQLGLSSEAQAQYQEVSRIHDQKGDAQGALQVLKRLVDLDSENVASRIKLAEGYSRAGETENAVLSFAKAAEILRRQNRIEDFVKVAERLIYHDPERLDVVTELARVYLSRGDTKRGLAKLQLCFKAEPRNVETLSLLAQAFLELGQTQKTIFVLKELATVHQEDGRAHEVKMTYQRILEHDPLDPDALAALGSISQGIPPVSGSVLVDDPPELLGAAAPAGASSRADAVLPAPSFAPPTVATSSGPDIPIEAPLSTLEASPPPDSVEAPSPADGESEQDRQIRDIITETDVFVRYGLLDKALTHLRRVFALDPDNPIAYEKMREIHLGANDHARAAEALANLMHVHAKRGDAEAHEAARVELAALAPGHPMASAGVTDALGETSDEDDLSIEITEDSGVMALADFDDAPSAPDDFDDDGPDFGMFEDATSGGVPDDDRAEVVGGLTSEASSSETSTYEGEPLREAASDFGASTVAPEDDDLYEDEAATLAVPGLIDPDEMQTTDRNQLPIAPIARDAPVSDPFAANVLERTGSAFEDEAPEPTLSEAAETEPLDIDAELAEVDFYMDNGLEDEAREALEEILAAAPQHPAALALMQQLSGDAPAGEAPQDAELERSDSDLALDGLDVESTVGDALQGAIEETSEPSEDPENQYDLGMVMMETMRFDEAISAFRTASEAPTRALSALEMIGHCYRQKGLPLEAVPYYVDAIERGADAPAAINLAYELGATFQEAGELQDALQWMERCSAQAPDHRDVKERIGALIGALRSPEAAPSEAPKSGKKNKISYL